MKIFLILATAICLVATISCGSSKKTAANAELSTIQKVQQMKDETTFIKAQKELDDAKAQHKHDIEQADKKSPILEVQLLEIPCFNEALDKEPDKYITGFGIGEPGINDSPYDQNLVYANALVMARNNIAEKWMGFIKNISNNYYAKTTIPTGTQVAQSNFERAVRTGGEKAINDFNTVICHNFAKTERGTYVCYLVSRVPMEKIKMQIANELEVLNTKYDQKLLFETVEKVVPIVPIGEE